jgi:predicted GIY-YIG superfamily endonuclease
VSRRDYHNPYVGVGGNAGSDLPHTVYTLCDRDMTALYVGMTADLQRRLKEHKRRSPDMMSRVRHVKVTRHPDREAAAEDEIRKRRRLRPFFNKEI